MMLKRTARIAIVIGLAGAGFVSVSPGPAAAQSCHAAYEPCIPDGPDLNCGDVVGPITVVTPGNDPYRLDRDGDGIACEGGQSVTRFADATTVDGIVQATDYANTADAPVLRLYQAYFNRAPDVDGAKYWLGIRRDGYDLLDIAGFMSVSKEFANTYAGTSDAEYVELVYQNVLGRGFDQEGYDYWLGLLESGQLDRPGIVFWITQNTEFIVNYPFTGGATPAR